MTNTSVSGLHAGPNSIIIYNIALYKKYVGIYCMDTWQGYVCMLKLSAMVLL